MKFENSKASSPQFISLTGPKGPSNSMPKGPSNSMPKGPSNSMPPFQVNTAGKKSQTFMYAKATGRRPEPRHDLVAARLVKNR